MRPEILFPLFAPVTSLKGVGQGLAKRLEKAAGPLVVDLLWHRPVDVIDRRFSPNLVDAQPGQIATLTIQVDAHSPPNSARGPWRVQCSDPTGSITLIFFHVKGDWIERALPLGATRIISGKIDAYGDQLQMSHPDHIATPGELDLAIEPVYGLTAGLSLKLLRKTIEAALARTPELPEWQDPALPARENWPSWRAALLALHKPNAPEDLNPDLPARRRLAYDELLADQIALALMRNHARHQPGRRIQGDQRLQNKVIAALPFQLTGAQRMALAEICGDMAAPERMLRLLQGDVGSGKTIVALLALLNAVETGAQGALMAPTELLARQHLATLTRLAAPAEIRIALLTGREKGKTRQTILADLAEGRLDILIGTHALFQDEVAYKDLALAVIDEQHRFGVEQRVQLAAKGKAVDVLVMTATPIPRSLMLTNYGDLDASKLDQKPLGRQPIKTSLISLDRLPEIVAAVGRALAQGTKIYWVCPLIEESETSDLAAVEARHADLVSHFGAERVGLLHGRMKPAERDQIMAGFSEGGIDLLIATTVIEVGVDVPAATIMVIEHAERFGLAQLHQLRGRIGRGSGASTCLLAYGPLGSIARARLTIMRETEDGFRIAEEDLRLRGAGEVLGTRQSGLPEYHLADLAEHSDLLALAHQDARQLLADDPDLAGPRGAAIRVLLYLFARDAAVRYLRSG